MGFFFTADDWGNSSQVNDAILKAHKAGTLQAASLMMNQQATAQAVQLSKANPSLQVGLHITLVDGQSTLPHHEIPGLVDSKQNFPKNPAFTWLKYFFSPWLVPQLKKEVTAQFEAFRLTGLKLSHVDGHHHQHIHPSIFKHVAKLAKAHGARWIRVPREDVSVWKEVTLNPEFLKKVHGLLYYGMTHGMKRKLNQEGFFTFDGVFGFLDTYSLSKEFVLNLLKLNPPGDFELYFHPGKSWNHDLEILLDPAVVALAKPHQLQQKSLVS